MYKAGFWIIAYMMHHPETLEIVHKEVTGAVVEDTLDEKHLSERCPVLDSVFNETLRLTVTNPLGRVATTKTTIGGKVLQEGKTLMVRQMYRSQSPPNHAE